MAYLHPDKDLNLDEDWVEEMRLVSDGLADEDYCHKLAREAPISAKYLEEREVKSFHHDEPNVLLEFNTAQHFVFPEGGGKAIISKLFERMRGYKDCDELYQTEAIELLTEESGVKRGLKVRKTVGLLHDLVAPNVVLAYGGFEGEF
jgi:aspartate oxidase